MQCVCVCIKSASLTIVINIIRITYLNQTKEQHFEQLDLFNWRNCKAAAGKEKNINSSCTFHSFKGVMFLIARENDKEKMGILFD